MILIPASKRGSPPQSLPMNQIKVGAVDIFSTDAPFPVTSLECVGNDIIGLISDIYSKTIGITTNLFTKWFIA